MRPSEEETGMDDESPRERGLHTLDRPVRGRASLRRDEANRNRRRAWQATLFAALVALLGVLLPYAVKGIKALSRPAVTILTPQPGPVASRDFNVSGTASHIPSGDELWIVDWPDQNRAWYPVAAVDVNGDGHWALTSTHVCSMQGIHNIQVWLVPLSAQKLFNTYVQKRAATKYSWNPGLQNTPDGSSPEATVQIQVPATPKICG